MSLETVAMAYKNPQAKLAVLIDADNTPSSSISMLLTEVAKYGVASVKRAYGDWTTPNLKGWKEVLHEYAILPIQQFRYTTGKNATDSAMIIDAMDLLYTDKLDGFCLVSSDSDFTRLATRLREAGLIVYGFGEKKTPKPFIGACDKFIFTELLQQTEESLPLQPKSSNELKCDTALINLLRKSIETSADDIGWAYLGCVGKNITKQMPEFDARQYGYTKLGELITATQLFDIDERVSDCSPGASIYVRDKRRRLDMEIEEIDE